MMTYDKKTNTDFQQGRIIVVDEDENVSSMVRAHFNHDGFSVDSCTEIYDVLSLNLSDYDLMIIDPTIGQNSGLTFVEQVKQHRDTMGLGVITASVNMSPTTIISALNAGADDYLLKPFSLRELMARARSVLRRMPARC